jgi:acetyl esterase/lipase
MYIAGHSAGGVLAVAESLLCHDKQMRDDFDIDERDYKYSGIILDCGVMHFYRKNIAYWGMRNMIFPKGYRKMAQYQYLVFENNRQLSTLPKTVLLTNEKDNLRDMTHYFKRVLDGHQVDHKLFDVGTDGHMGIIYKPYTEENQRIIDDVQEYFGIGL